MRELSFVAFVREVLGVELTEYQKLFVIDGGRRFGKTARATAELEAALKLCPHGEVLSFGKMKMVCCKPTGTTTKEDL